MENQEYIGSKKEFIVTDIKYDTDGEEIDLPTTLKIIVPSEMTDFEEIDEFLSDQISEVTGFCHKGFKIDSYKFI